MTISFHSASVPIRPIILGGYLLALISVIPIISLKTSNVYVLSVLLMLAFTLGMLPALYFSLSSEKRLRGYIEDEVDRRVRVYEERLQRGIEYYDRLIENKTGKKRKTKESEGIPS